MVVDGIDVDADGIAHLHAVGRWLQQVAVADAVDAGMSRETAWIVRRTTITSERLPRFGEPLELRTRCSGAAKSVAERTTTIAGGRGAAVEAVAIWVHLDPRLRRPSRLPEDFLAIYGAAAGGRRPRSSLRHPPAPPADAERHEWRFTAADIDYAGHVNNTAYWRIAEQLFGLAPLANGPVRLEIEYRGGVGAGPAVVHRAAEMLWVCDPGEVVAATISVAAPPARAA